MEMESQGRRLVGALAAAALIVAGLALPATGQAVKPTAKLQFEVPDEGRVGFSHLLFKAKKKGKVVSGRAAKRIKRKSEKLDKKVGVSAKLRGKGSIPEAVQVLASLARVKGEKNLYALDVAVLHTGAGAQPLHLPSAKGARGGGAPPAVSLQLSSLPITHETQPFAQLSTRLRLVDGDVTTEDPEFGPNVIPCSGLFGISKNLGFVLAGNAIDLGPPADDALEVARKLACDQPIPDHLAPLFDLLDLDQPETGPFNCTGINVVPSPTNPTFGHRFTGGTCNQNIAVIDFDLLEGTYYGFQNVPLPSCAFANGNSRVHCTNPNDLNKRTIVGAEFGTLEPNSRCIRITVQNKTGRQFRTVVPTQMPATCP